MQGAFSAGVDWGAALDPGPDEEIQAKVRSDIIEREIQRLTQIRAPGVAPAPVPPNPWAYDGGPYPATPHFRIGVQTYYILKHGMENEMARPGIWGHYLVATVTVKGSGPAGRRSLARPFVNPKRVTRQAEASVRAPGMDPLDKRAIPFRRFCLPGRDYILATDPPSYHEIGLNALKEALEQAEALDLAFARRMEGLGNVAAQVCWDCLDPDYDPSDRPAVMEQFMGKYLDRFYSGIDPENGPPTGAVADEVLQKHRAFCQAWVRRHYKTLTPAITGPAEALASDFYPYMENMFHPDAKPTRMELARLLMRHEETAAEFATCLHYYSTSLEQARGGRNANYKQMTMVTMSRATSHKRMGDLLGSKATLLRGLFETFQDEQVRAFCPFTLDWHAILGQMPQVHRFFDNSSVMQGLVKRARRQGTDPSYTPPWRIR